MPHIQFKSPEEWDQFFQANGFRIVARDMTIGHFVNDWWNGLLSIPLRTYVYPVLEVIAFRGKFDLNPGQNRIDAVRAVADGACGCPRSVVEALRSRFGWNLIVA